MELKVMEMDWLIDCLCVFVRCIGIIYWCGVVFFWLMFDDGFCFIGWYVDVVEVYCCGWSGGFVFGCSYSGDVFEGDYVNWEIRCWLIFWVDWNFNVLKLILDFCGDDVVWM